VRSDPWTAPEDELLLEKVNALGFAWSAIAHCFNGRSDSDVKNRWYAHLKFETFWDGDKFVLAAGDEGPCPGRKKRNRLKVSPKQNALRLLEQQRGAITGMLRIGPEVGKKQPENPPVSEVEDIWDRITADDDADEGVSVCPLF
jgi:hypothetical protein